MRKLILLVTVGALAACGPKAPMAASPLNASSVKGKFSKPVKAANGGRLKVGTVLGARVDERLATNESRPGDRFTARVITPVVDEQGNNLLDGAHLTGRVVSVATGRGEGPARLVLAVDGLRAHGCTRPLAAEVWAVDVEQVPRAAPGQPVRGGAVGGGLLGALFLGIPGMWLGGGVGAAGGVAEYEGAKKIDARLSTGGLLVVHVDEAAKLPSPAARPSGHACA